MKPVIIFSLFLLSTLALPESAFCDSMDELIRQFGEQYESIKKPSPNSSVNTDYQLDQAALGAVYTTKALNLIYRQNQEIMVKYDEMLLKYNEVIKQNAEIIQLLKVIAKKEISETGTTD